MSVNPPLPEIRQPDSNGVPEERRKEERDVGRLVLTAIDTIKSINLKTVFSIIILLALLSGNQWVIMAVNSYFGLKLPTSVSAPAPESGQTDAYLKSQKDEWQDRKIAKLEEGQAKQAEATTRLESLVSNANGKLDTLIQIQSRGR